jgi:hypothetical protein
MQTCNFVAPAMSRVGTLGRAPDCGAPTPVGEGRQRLLQLLAGPANIAPFHRPPHTRPPRSIGRPASQAERRCANRQQ